MITRHLMTRTAALHLLGTLVAALPGAADEADAFFDDRVVHEIRITLDDPSWYETLLAGLLRRVEGWS